MNEECVSGKNEAAGECIRDPGFPPNFDPIFIQWMHLLCSSFIVQSLK